MRYASKYFTIEAEEIDEVCAHEERLTYSFHFKSGKEHECARMACGDRYPMPGDFFVFRPDGDNYLCPKKVFNEKYEAMDSDQMSFGDAILSLKHGHKVARSGWNGKGMFLYYVPANSYPAQTDIAKKYWGAKQNPIDFTTPVMVPYGAYVAMKTAQENVVPWLASQTDVLAEDWQILE